MEFDNSIPIYQQIADIIKQMIISKELKIGEKIKSVRELAQEMGVNPNTVQKALSALEAEQLLHSERTSGRFVTENTEIVERLRENMISKIINEFFKSMEQMGISKTESMEKINQFLKGEGKNE